MACFMATQASSSVSVSIPMRSAIPDQQAMLAIYIPAMRQRFKAEVNRLTSRAMRKMLEGNPYREELTFPFSYLYALHWLQHNVDAKYRKQVLDNFRAPARLFLMQLLLSDNAESFIHGYIQYWQNYQGQGPVQQAHLLKLLADFKNDKQQLADYMLEIWHSLKQFEQTHKTAYAKLARNERNRYEDMLGAEDVERLSLVDKLKDPAPGKPRFAKLGLIPVMGCPQTCRHCMFIWRPLKPVDADSKRIYKLVDSMTDSVLFTGGDLTRHLEHLHDAIRSMRNISTFAILLNGDFADDTGITEQTIKNMANAIKGRPKHWAKARVLLQISFDEFHQEVYVDKKGDLRERIPVAKIANIVETAPRYGEQIQLALLHKQTRLNFSMDVLHKGVFARLVNELGDRGHKIEVLSTTPSARNKRSPDSPDKLAPVLKDASFVLSQYPQSPILMTSSTIDGYGRAETLDESETVKEKDLLDQVINTKQPTGESFDTDLMFWFNGWVTLFNAVHMCLGNLYEDGADIILARQRKDPLTKALNIFDRRLLDFYSEVREDLNEKIEAATGPHHLFHTLTEDPVVRLHMTKRLINAV